MSDEIINYHDLSEHEKDKALRQLNGLGFTPAYGSISCMKNEMEKSKGHTLPQYIFVRRSGEFIGYMFLIAESEKVARYFRGGQLIILTNFVSNRHSFTAIWN